MPHFTEPAFLATYGPSGWRKTTDCLYSFPNAIYIAAPGALKPWKDIVGIPYEPAHAPRVHLIQEATALIKQEGSSSRWNAVVIDDFSLISDETHASIDKNYSEKETRKMWGAIREVLIDFRSAARDAKLHVILNCHLRNPHQHEKKGYIMGGPALPGTMPEDLPKACDTVLRVVKDESGLYPAWPFLYSGDETNGTFVEKDRHGLVPIAAKVVPMNIGEILRRGFGVEGPLGISRPRGLEWMEKVVSQISAQLRGHKVGSADHRGLLTAFKAKIEEKYTKDERHIAWCFRDAIARAFLDDAHAKGMLSGYLQGQAGGI